MIRRGSRLVPLFLGVVLGPACGGGDDGPPPSGPDESLAGGATTVFNASDDAFGFPAANLSAARSDPFFVGNSFFKTNWVTAPASTDGRDGLGPLFNAVSCSACHLKDGRGRPPLAGSEGFLGLLLRISVPGADPVTGAPLPDPSYGSQIQQNGILGVDGEAVPQVSYVEVPGTYGDGSAYSLRQPTYSLASPAYGPPAPGLLMSPRVAPAVFGLGLLEAIPESALLSRADPADADGDGISGRANRVWDVRAGASRFGRFGWKANVPTVEQQSAGAFLGDIGITTPLFMTENCTAPQASCQAAPNGGTPEFDQAKLDELTFYMKTLAVPGRRSPAAPGVLQGKAVFMAAGCAKCHVPMHVTGMDPAFPELSNQTIFPYTDLLLHDLGPGLADGRPDFLADGQEWRTPPLWGLGLVPTVNGHSFLLHDGRARDMAEAILWHGGEAEAAKEHFRLLPAAQRQALIDFLNDL
jgi:CxxC motif-containing protein (DUF1111 family)